jgi:hypothetical protein
VTGCAILDSNIAARKNGKQLPCEALQADNAKLRELVCHLYYVKPRDVTSILVNGEVLDFDELMAEVGLRWEDA